MAEQVESITILKIGTDEAVRNIADLRENIRLYKEALNEVSIGSEDYKNILRELEDNQAALRNALHGTATSMEQIAAAAKGQDMSYNGLVRTMAIYKEELRAIDTSTAEGVEAFKAKAQQIQAVNQKLKDLDAMQGNYQRNVGNYKSAVEGLSGAFKATAGSAASVINPVANLTNGLKVLSATPVLGMLGLLANALTKVAGGIKTSEDNTNAWNRALAAFQPVADAFTRSMQKVGEVAANVANGIVDLLEKWGWLSDEARERQALADQDATIAKMAREVMVENAKSAKAAAEDRAKAAEKDKYTAEQRLKFLQDAYLEEKAIATREKTLAQMRYEAAKIRYSTTENDKTANDELARLEADAINAETQFAQKMRRLNSELYRTRQEIIKGEVGEAKAAVKSFVEELESEDIHDEIFPDFILDPDGEIRAENQQLFDGLIAQQEEYNTNAERLRQEDRAAQEAALEWQRQHEAEVAALNKEKVDSYLSMASSISDVFGALADIYEANGEEDEKSVQQAKALRTASAIISTISGAISAYMNTIESVKVPQIAIPLAVANAATVAAAGFAQIKQINAVKVGGSSAGATVAAPTYTPNITQVRSVTGASEEERLNRMAADQRVYILASDLQAERRATRVQIQETSF